MGLIHNNDDDGCKFFKCHHEWIIIIPYVLCEIDHVSVIDHITRSKEHDKKEKEYERQYRFGYIAPYVFNGLKTAGLEKNGKFL